jgi:mannose-6-phosphate isomerase-like protein (cupin superfamily)
MVGDASLSGRLVTHTGRRSFSRRRIRAQMLREGLSPYEWRSYAGEFFDWHSHDFHDIICCVSGSIIFHLETGDFLLSPGDRLEMDRGTRHAATVGREGVICLEAKT